MAITPLWQGIPHASRIMRLLPPSLLLRRFPSGGRKSLGMPHPLPSCKGTHSSLLCLNRVPATAPWSGFVLFRFQRNSLAGCWVLPRPTRALPLTREGLSALSKPILAAPWSGFVLFRLRRNSLAGCWALPRPTRALPLTHEGLSALSKPVLRLPGLALCSFAFGETRLQVTGLCPDPQGRCP